MRVNSISSYNFSVTKNNAKRQNFGNAYVTLSKPNLSDVISENVDRYNQGDFKKMYEDSRKSANKVIANVNATLETTNGKIKTVDDLVKKVDLYILAAGSGSRFRPMATAIADLRGKNESFNKISVPFELGRGQQPLTMLDIPMAMGRFFAPKEGYSKIVAEKPTGSFGDVILNYLERGKPLKDVVVCCGDNVFDMKSEDMLDFIVRTINNPKKQLGVVGVARTPEEVAKRFGVLAVGEQDEVSKNFPLKGFVEKPELEAAKKLATDEGVNIANTGMFTIKKESMEKLLDIIRHERKVLGGKTLYIAKDPEKEIFDFAAATKRVRDINGTGASDVLMVKTWEDVGEPQAYKRWAEQIRDEHYLSNFTPKRRQIILDEIRKRVKGNSIQFSLEPKGKAEIDGIEIIA